MDFEGIDVSANSIPLDQTMKLQIIRGTPSPRYFGKQTCPRAVGTSSESTAPFHTLVRLDSDDDMFLVFSQNGLSATDIATVFENCQLLSTNTWQFFPNMHTVLAAPPIEIRENIFDANALDPLFSPALETQLLSAHNIARLILSRL